MNAKKSSVLDGYMEKENLTGHPVDVQWKEKLFSALLKKLIFKCGRKNVKVSAHFNFL